MMGRKAHLALRFALSSCCRSAVATLLLVVELQILQALRQGQFLLDSHAQERVQGLLLVLCSSQLPLHVVQLGHVLVTPETDRRGKGQTLQGDISSSGRRSFSLMLSRRSTASSFPRLFQTGGCLCLTHTTITSDISQHAFQRQECLQNNCLISIIYAFDSSSLPEVVGSVPVIMHNYTLSQTWLEERRT